MSMTYGNIVWQGGYCLARWRSSRHGDERTKEAGQHKLLQRSFRAASESSRLKTFLENEQRAWNRLIAPVEKALMMNIDRGGKLLSIEERDAMLQEHLRDRTWYYRSDGKKEKLRSQPYKIDSVTGEFICDKNGRRVRDSITGDRVNSVKHIAITRDPRLSRMIVLAALAGKVALAREFSRQGALGITRKFEAATGYVAVDTGGHTSTMASHPQIEYDTISANHQKLGRDNPFTRNLDKKMISVWRWRRMGISGAALDALTGVPNSDLGLDEALADRGETALDLDLQDKLDDSEWERIRTPQFAELLPFLDGAERYYADYLQRRAEAVSGTETVARMLRTAEEIEDEAHLLGADVRIYLALEERDEATGELENLKDEQIRRQREGREQAEADADLERQGRLKMEAEAQELRDKASVESALTSKLQERLETERTQKTKSDAELVKAKATAKKFQDALGHATIKLLPFHWEDLKAVMIGDNVKGMTQPSSRTKFELSSAGKLMLTADQKNVCRLAVQLLAKQIHGKMTIEEADAAQVSVGLAKQWASAIKELSAAHAHYAALKISDGSVVAERFWSAKQVAWRKRFAVTEAKDLVLLDRVAELEKRLAKYEPQVLIDHEVVEHAAEERMTEPD